MIYVLLSNIYRIDIIFTYTLGICIKIMRNINLLQFLTILATILIVS